jgi:hypothetical protein
VLSLKTDKNKNGNCYLIKGEKMKISASDILLNSYNISHKESYTYEKLKMWDKKYSLTYENKDGILNSNISYEIKNEQKSVFANPNIFLDKNLLPENDVIEKKLKKILDNFISDIKTQIIKDMVEMLTGKKIKVLKLSDIKKECEECENTELQNIENSQNTSNSSTQLQGWGIDYSYKEVKYIKEGFNFEAKGSVTTSNGIKINFDVTLQMSSEKYEEISVSFKAGDALKDPLILDLTGEGIGFLQERFEFDIDSNGMSKYIYTPKQNCGFLAYDKNGNGIIDNGGELFGPSSGNGFLELLKLDQDKNGWIDESDSAFNNLKVWQKDQNNNDIVKSLKEVGIGAIYTKDAKTLFTITNSKEEQIALLRTTGIYLYENGKAGTISEVDVVV